MLCMYFNVGSLFSRNVYEIYFLHNQIEYFNFKYFRYIKKEKGVSGRVIYGLVELNAVCCMGGFLKEAGSKNGTTCQNHI
jgi:hypothetical protein